MVAVINVDAYLFLAFSDLTCHPEDTRIGLFWLHCVPDSKEIELESSNQEASPSAGKSTGVVSVPCCTWKCFPTAISGGVDISEVPDVTQFSVRVKKLLQELVSLEFTAYLSVFDLFSTQ